MPQPLLAPTVVSQPMHPFLVVPLELVRATPALISPLPHQAFSRSQAVMIRLLRGLLGHVPVMSPSAQRTLLGSPAVPLPTAVEQRSVDVLGRSCLEWSHPSADRSRRLLFFHGGGYVVGAPEDGRSFWAALAPALGVPVVAASYGLAPEHSAEQAVEHAMAALQSLLDEGVPAENILVGGDSAGAGLAVRLLMALRDVDGPQLAGGLLGCPWTDLTGSGASVTDNAPFDYLTADVLRTWAHLVSDHPKDPDLSCRYANLIGLPPLFVVAGDLEILRDDILAFSDAAEAAGVPVERWVAPHAVHCWYVQPGGLLPGPTDALDRFTRSGRRMLGLPAP